MPETRPNAFNLSKSLNFVTYIFSSEGNNSNFILVLKQPLLKNLGIKIQGLKDFQPFFCTLEFGIDVGQGITVGPGKFSKKNKRRALNKRRA